MNEEEKRRKRLCFTGHRPEKLHHDEAEVCSILRKAIDAAMANGFTTFISGMARGVDIWAAEIVLEKKRMNPEVGLREKYVKATRKAKKHWMKSSLRNEKSTTEMRLALSEQNVNDYSSEQKILMEQNRRIQPKCISVLVASNAPGYPWRCLLGKSPNPFCERTVNP